MKNSKPWTIAEDQQLCSMLHDDWPWAKIAMHLHRSAAGCLSHYNKMTADKPERVRGVRKFATGPDATPEQLQERDRLVEARYTRDLTSTFFGDPPKGYSALDQMRARVS